jgi:predicted methyltransferase
MAWRRHRGAEDLNKGERLKTLLAISFVLLASCANNPGGLSSERIAQIVASPDRSAADRKNDVRRKPEEMLGFIGVRPGMLALDISAGGGYTTELIARAVGPTGRVYAQSTRAASAERVMERAKNPALGNIVAVVRKFEDPVPPEAQGKLDLVTLMFNYHDFAAFGVDRAELNRAVFAALKPGGMYVIADHSGRAGTGVSESGTLHRIEEAFLRREVEAAGFRLAEEGRFLRNSADPRDRETPDPPMPKDEFVLKFVKP